MGQRARTSLAELATDITDGDHMPPPKAETGIPFITISNVNKKTNEIDLSNTFKVSHSYFNALKDNKKPRVGDVLYTVTGSFGIPIIVSKHAEFCFQRHIGLIRPKAHVDSKWLFYMLMSPQVILQTNEGATGTAQKTVSLKVLRRITVPRVPLDEQKRIVAVLDEAFEGIETATANTEKNLASAREIFESYLNSVFTKRVESWSKKSLEEIGLLQTGTTPKTSEKDNLGTYIPFIKPGDFREDGSLDYENEGLSKLGLTQSRLIRGGSAVMVCIGATIGKAGFAERDISANQQINAVTPGEGIAGKFLYYQMISDGFQKQVMANSAQATLPIINKTKWGGLVLLLPPTRREQEQLVSRLDQLSSEVQRLEETYRQKLASLAELKEAILQKAFAGELTAQPDNALPKAAE